MQEATRLPGGYSLPTWQQHARRDDCLDRMVPSDLRQFLGLIERQQQVIDLLMKAVEPFAEVAASDRISQLSDDDLADDVDFCLPAIAFRRAREAKVEAERILNHSHP